ERQQGLPSNSSPIASVARGKLFPVGSGPPGSQAGRRSLPCRTLSAWTVPRSRNRHRHGGRPKSASQRRPRERKRNRSDRRSGRNENSAPGIAFTWGTAAGSIGLLAAAAGRGRVLDRRRGRGRRRQSGLQVVQGGLVVGPVEGGEGVADAGQDGLTDLVA